MKTNNNNKRKMSCYFDNSMMIFIESYAKALGDIPLANAVENLVTKGISNIEEQKAMNTKYLNVIERMELKREMEIKKMNEDTERIISVIINESRKNLGASSLLLSYQMLRAPESLEELKANSSTKSFPFIAKFCKENLHIS